MANLQPTGITWYTVANQSNVAIPPNSLVFVTGLNANYQPIISQCSVSGATAGVLVTGPATIPPNSLGQAHNQFPCAVSYDPSTGTPGAGQTWGLKAGSWQLVAGQTGFMIVGGANGQSGLVVVIPQPPAGSGVNTAFEHTYNSGSFPNYSATATTTITIDGTNGLTAIISGGNVIQGIATANYASLGTWPDVGDTSSLPGSGTFYPGAMTSVVQIIPGTKALRGGELIFGLCSVGEYTVYGLYVQEVACFASPAILIDGLQIADGSNGASFGTWTPSSSPGGGAFISSGQIDSQGGGGIEIYCLTSGFNNSIVMTGNDMYLEVQSTSGGTPTGQMKLSCDYLLQISVATGSGDPLNGFTLNSTTPDANGSNMVVGCNVTFQSDTYATNVHASGNVIALGNFYAGTSAGYSGTITFPKVSGTIVISKGIIIAVT